MRRALKVAAALAVAAIATVPATAQWPGISGAVPQMNGINFNNNGTGIVVAGIPWMRFNNQNVGLSSVTLGKYAGINLPDTQGMIAIGDLAMASQTDGTGETVVISPWGAPYAQLKSSVLIGEHVLGVDPSATACTAIGADVLRDTAGCVGGTVYGSGAVIDGNFVDDIVIGWSAMHGTTANVTIGPGTPNAGDVISVNLTTNDTGGNVVGLPRTITYTVVAGDTTTLLLAQHLHAAIDSGLSGILYTKPAIPGVPTRATAPLVTVGGDNSDSLGNYYIAFHADGTQTVGMKLVVAASCSGVCTAAIGATGASSPLHNTLIGRSILAGVGMSNPQSNVLIGNSVAQNGTSLDNNVVVGANAGQVLATGNANALVGFQAGKTITTGSNNLCLGNSACSATLTTGGNNIILTTNGAAAYDVDTANRSNMISIGGVVKFQNASLNPPTMSACGTSPSVDANANGVAGTITVGSGSPTSCTATFAAAYRQFNHCVITSQAVNASFAYSYTLAAMTVTGSALTGKIDYWCSGN